MGHEPRPSWICRDAFERARFADLNARLVRVNTRVLIVVALLIAVALPTIGNPVALLPSAAGIAFFGVVQRRSASFARPELWVFAALLGAETMIAVALLLNGSAAATGFVLPPPSEGARPWQVLVDTAESSLPARVPPGARVEVAARSLRLYRNPRAR